VPIEVEGADQLGHPQFGKLRYFSLRRAATDRAKEKGEATTRGFRV